MEKHIAMGAKYDTLEPYLYFLHQWSFDLIFQMGSLHKYFGQKNFSRDFVRDGKAFKGYRSQYFWR